MIVTRILSCRAEIEHEDPRLAQTLEYLRHGARQPFPERRTFRYEVRGDSPYRLYEEGDFLQEVDGTEDVLFVLYSRIHRRVIERFVHAGWVVYHAALAEVAGRSILLLGDSGAGKTTLSLRLMLAGHAVHGDELVLERDHQLLALPRAFHLKDGIEREVPELRGSLESLPRMENGAVRALDPTRIGLDWHGAPARADLLVWIVPNHGGQTRVEGKPPYRAIRRALRAIPGWGEVRSHAVASATRLGKRGGARLDLGGAREAVACLEALAG